ncbi:MAG: PAS domain S-box protein [Pseudomonadota bacterium]
MAGHLFAEAGSRFGDSRRHNLSKQRSKSTVIAAVHASPSVRYARALRSGIPDASQTRPGHQFVQKTKHSINRDGGEAIFPTGVPDERIVPSTLNGRESSPMIASLAVKGWSEHQSDCRRVFEENTQPMWVSEGHDIVEVNRAAMRHYGYSRDEFLAMTVEDIEATDAPAEVPPPVLRPPASDVGHDVSTGRHQRKDGPVVDVETTSFPITFAGRPAQLVSILDVTYRRRTEAQTRYLDLLLATVTDAVVASDDKFVLTAWNAAAESTYGRRADEVLGQPDALVFRTDFIGVERAEAIQRLVETGHFHGELTHRRGDGKRIHIESRAAAFFDGGGKRLGYVSVNRDITDRRYAEETIRALLNDVLAAQEEERRRIARELHDETAQTLTSLLVGLRTVEEAQDLGHAQGAASTLRVLVSAALDGIQRIAWGLRPSVLDDLGLEEALERLAADVARANTFAVDLHATGARMPRLPEAIEIALYRVTQEALTNAAKHATPKAVSVLIHRNPNVVRLVVEDDGRGFDVAAAQSDTQLGLVGMRERAHLVGGAMTVESSPGRGTTICVTVPLPVTPPAAP